MLVLVVDDNKQTRDALVRHLQTAEYRVVQAADVKGGQIELDREKPDVVMLAWTSGSQEFLKRIRALDASGRSYVIVLLDRNPASDIAALYASGADDFLRLPAVREEVLGRVDAPRRIRGWASGSHAMDWSEKFDLQKLQVWRDLGAVIAEDIAQLTGPFDVSEAADFQGEVRGASIPLSLAKDETELRVSIVAEPAQLRALGGVLLGDENSPESALDDMLRELANTAGGAVKRAALLEQVAVTTGLPVSESRAVVPADKVRVWSAKLRGTDVRIGLVGEVVSRANQRVQAANLREGMVLAHDLRNPLGALVMPAGTRLTATAAERVGKLLGPRFVVEVACTA